MLATFVIGLREGLEAALIVGIIAAFLKKNGRPLRTMWIGVVAAILISIAVGVVLKVVESALPQRQQELMETVIGSVAIFFVTGMVIWMSTHARGLKREIESAAQSALGAGTSRALVVMAFLAVLKEGFETAVFLLATFQASSNTSSAVVGAVLGILCSAAVGFGLYTGGVTLNLGKFFKVTSGFLILIAGGLTVTALRTAHEAGILNAGQGRTADLSWLAPSGSIRSAVFTGVLGIPAYPRLIEVLGWFLYVVPMALIVYWPARHRPNAQQSVRLKLALAAGCAVAAGVLVAVVPTATLRTPDAAPVVDGSGAKAGAIRFESAALTGPGAAERHTLQRVGPRNLNGVKAIHYTARPASAAAPPATLTLAQVSALNGNRLPVGIDPGLNPGPFDAKWQRSEAVDVSTVHGRLYDATRRAHLSVTLSGGGLTTARTLTVSPGANLPSGVSDPGASWTVATSYVDDFGTALSRYASDQDAVKFWGRVAPVGLLVTAAALVVAALRARRRLQPVRSTPSATVGTPSPRSSSNA
ncbi:iron uptake transporter permease EfeU [Flexivirga caeni]|uniref:Ferrous iron transporter n=1 Tax=Flexivirga caeni TaxID=2294115 RepID=A0A3M9LXX7_9MICO|nr:iron uptake transporter permease EfeU [Flexivirga caeni]RNI17775.1 hypothetical protein EFY87_19085 [Flexivirga caeni]